MTMVQFSVHRGLASAYKLSALCCTLLTLGLGCHDREKSTGEAVLTEGSSLVSGPKGAQNSSAGALSPPPSPTVRPEPRLAFGQPTGYMERAGLVFRVQTMDCPDRLPRDGVTCVSRGPQSKNGCSTDHECQERPQGFCQRPPGVPSCSCSYGCAKDSDCGAGEVCLCGEPSGVCVPLDCPNGCPEPERCATYFNGCRYVDFTCREHSETPNCKH